MTIYTLDGIAPQIDASAWVHEQAYVSGDVHLAAEVGVWPMAAIRGDVAAIRIGAQSNVQDGAVIHATHQGSFTPQSFPTTIGERVTIGHNAVVHGCTIADEVLVGMGAVVLDGAVVEERVLIAAGALVPPGKRLESGFLYAGNPAKVLRPLTEKELEFFAYSARHYLALARRHREKQHLFCRDEKALV